MELFRVAATQLDVRHLDVDHNLEEHLRLIGAAAEDGCRLVVFPELSVTGHNGSPEVTRLAEPYDGPIARTIEAQARECGIVVAYGFCELFRGTHSRVGGAYVVAPDGSLAAAAEPSVTTGWIGADLDPGLLRVVRENPWFALRKRRPETYEELTRAL